MDGSPVRAFAPGYFALVMATGIIAIGLDQQGFGLGADVFFAVTAAAYAVLVVMSVVRAIRYPGPMVSDATHHSLGFAFLTTVAGTNVLGAAAAVIHGWWGLAWILWWVSLPIWVVYLYTSLIATVLRTDKPDLRHGINGTWFMLTVSGESIVVLAGLLLTRTTDDALAFFAVCVFALGFVLYLIVMSMVFLRWTFRPVDPEEIDPPMWIAAGAVAITALAGANLQAAAPQHARLIRLIPFIEGTTMMAWATATFWLPLMAAVWVWRYLVERVRLTYHPSFWSLVFPLGMYAVASEQMFRVLAFDQLGWLPRATLVVALAAWFVTCVGMVRPSQRTATPTGGQAASGAG